MRNTAIIAGALVVAAASTAPAQTLWTGPSITFSKAAFADPTDPANQDRMTDNVWITRAALQGIYNAAQENGFSGTGQSSPSPVDTGWAFGTTADDLSELAFGTWGDLHDGDPPSLLDQDIVVHLISDNIYLDLKFTAWGVGPGAGGSFTYIRSTPTPGAAALFGFAAVAATRRRR